MPKIPFWIFVVIAVLYFTGVRVDTMDVDASQYAEMSREMMESGDYLHMYDRGIEYLDKPPMLFWLSASSMWMFGVNNFGYKLPSILFAIWALFATYKLGKRLYDDATGRMAALILGTCQGMFLMTNDVRCDTVLMSCVITSLWLIQEWVVSKKLWYLIGGSAAIAFGMMTKGPIALMVPIFCFGTDWVLKRQWKNFLSPAFIPALITIAVLLIPMSIGLYQQFDMHPEKLVNGSTGVSGLRFFYWSQSFGRITGESPWNNGAKLDFLLLNMLWSFLPWIFLFVIALVLNSIKLVRQKFRIAHSQEWMTFGGFLLAYIALGSSAYQLPHYIFVVFPLAAIITARFVQQLIEDPSYKKLRSIMAPVHSVIAFLLLIAVLQLIAIVFPANGLIIALWCVCMVFWLFVLLSKKIKNRILWLPASAMLIVNLFLTNYFYYPLLQYQVGSQVGRYISEQNIDTKDVVIYKLDDPLNAIQFYAKGPVRSIDTLPDLKNEKYLLTMKKGLALLTESGYSYEIQTKGDFYKVSELTLPFLNPTTRKDAVKQYFLVKTLSHTLP